MAGRRSRLAEGLAVLSLIVLSAFLILSLNSLAWPFGGVSSSSPTTTVSTSRGNLTVILDTVISTIPGSNNSTFHPYSNNSSESPAQGVTVLVYFEYSTHTLNPMLDKETNSTGIVAASMAPALYTVVIGDPDFNLTVNLEVLAGWTTTLHAVMNETDYPANAFDLVDTDSANYVGEWNEVFARIQTNDSIPTSRVSTYLRFYTGLPFGVAEQINGTIQVVNNGTVLPINTAPATILSSSKGSDSQWLQLRLPQFFSVEGVDGLEVFTRVVTATVSIVAG